MKGQYPSTIDGNWTDIRVQPKDSESPPYYLSRNRVEISGSIVYVFDRTSPKKIGYVPIERCSFVQFIVLSNEPDVDELP